MGDGLNRGTRLGEHGFTLIETLVALTLIVIAIIPLTMILTSALRQVSVDKAQSRAREIAVSEQSKVRSMTFGAIGLTSATQTFSEADDDDPVKPDAGYPGIAPGPEQQVEQNNSYSVTRDIRKTRDQYNGTTSTKKVVITVSWTTPAPGGSYTLPDQIGQTAMAP